MNIGQASKQSGVSQHSGVEEVINAGWRIKWEDNEDETETELEMEDGEEAVDASTSADVIQLDQAR